MNLGVNLGWKTHAFFEKEQQAHHEVPDTAICSCACGDQLAIGCSDGVLLLLDKSLHVTQTLQAFQLNLTAMQYLKADRVLLVVGQDEAAAASTALKCYNMEAAAGGKQLAEPPRLRTLKLFGPRTPDATPAACLAAHSDGWPNGSVAVGLADGALLLIRGNLMKDRVQRSTLSMAPVGNTIGAITGLAFMGHEGSLYLFASTPKLTVAFNAMTGTKTGSAECVVGRSDAFYTYTPDGRGSCFVFEGKKTHLKQLRQYLAAVVATQAQAARGACALQVYDLRNKLIASTLQLQQVLCAWGIVVVVHSDNTATCLMEKPLSRKLELLYNKNLYPVALSLAQSEEADAGTIAEIQRRHADHLYARHDYDSAVAQYVATIGHLEPSYVIKKYLDAQRIYNLTSYLEQLHGRGLASSDHTTLLLNCYTRMKDVAKLDRFLRGNDGDNGTPLLNFDIDTAVKVCRAAGYYDHALYVAHAAHEPEWYLDILVDDCGRWDDALAYLQDLARQEAAAALRRHGKVLLTHRPEATTAMLMQLCTPSDSSKPDGDWLAKVSDFAHLASDRPMALMLLCEYILNSTRSPPGEESLYHILLELYLTGGSSEEAAASPKQHQPEQQRPAGGDGKGSEAQAQQATPGAQRQAKPISRQYSEQAVDLLKRGWPPGEEPKYDISHVLVLCRMHGFRPGLILLYENMRLFREVMQVHMAAGDHEGLIEACMRLGDASKGGDPQLWSEVLEYFGRQQSDVTDQVQEVLRHIEAGKLMPPLVVLSTLARNPLLRLSIVRDYVARQLRAESAHIEDDRQAIARYAAETAHMRAEAAELRGKARVFQNSKDALSGAPLELPAVHFLCGHSFNLRSLGENEQDCPLCAPGFRTILDIRRSMRAGAAEQDKFFTQLKASNDGFSVIADFFGRGILNVAEAAAESA